MPRNQVGNNKGISIIEILVVIAILGVTLSSLLGLINFSLSASNLNKQTIQATALAQEIMEIIRNFRDQSSWEENGLGVLTIGTAYHPEKTTANPVAWNLVLGQEVTGIFTREVVFEKVWRDSDDNITASGNEDPNTKKARVSVFWQGKGGSHQVELVSFFTNWRQ